MRGKKAGYGVLINRGNGNEYHGYWKNDKKDGLCTTYFSSGESSKGFYEDGLENGEFRIYNKDERLLRVLIYRKGLFIREKSE